MKRLLSSQLSMPAACSDLLDLGQRHALTDQRVDFGSLSSRALQHRPGVERRTARLAAYAGGVRESLIGLPTLR